MKRISFLIHESSHVKISLLIKAFISHNSTHIYIYISSLRPEGSRDDFIRDRDICSTRGQPGVPGFGYGVPVGVSAFSRFGVHTDLATDNAAWDA